MPLTQLTNVPQSTDPDNFSARADNLIGFQFPRLIDEINALQLSGGSGTGAITQVENADSGVHVKIANGYGTERPYFRRFQYQETNYGSDILYTDSVTNGGSFTILTSGIYSISYSDQFNTSGTPFAISIYGGVHDIPLNNTYGIGTIFATSHTSAANKGAHCSWTGFLLQNTIIVAFTDGTPSGTAESFCQFSIFRAKNNYIIGTTSGAPTGSTLGIVNTTSTTSNSLTLGSKTFIVAANLGILPNMHLLFYVASVNSDRMLFGIVTSYNATTGELIVNILQVTGNTDKYLDDSLIQSATSTSSNWLIRDTTLTFKARDSHIAVYGANGYGTTQTTTRRFTTLNSLLGESISYIDSAANGARFVINETGLYVASYSDIFDSTASATIAISKDISTLSQTRTVEQLNPLDILGVAQSNFVSGVVTCAAVSIMQAGDAFVARTSGGTTSGNNGFSQFRVARII